MAFLERLPSMCETLGSILSISKKKKEREIGNLSLVAFVSLKIIVYTFLSLKIIIYN